MLPQSAIAAMIAWNAITSAPPIAADTTTEQVAGAASAATSALPLSIGNFSLGRDTLTLPRARAEAPTALSLRELATDTVPRTRRKSFAVSDAYQTRITIHRRLSWAMLPLFAASYFSGDQLFAKGSSAPQWARSLHRPAATGAAVLFTANMFTGTWNLWESRSNPNGRTRRIVHSVLFTAASAGFVYGGTKLANEAEQSQSKREQHRNLALGSIGVSTVSWLIMLIGN